ncbi:MAG: hypothetical protein IPP29_19360 [Bacteroidetes bacterium]|nr:hypothetical protein [Bacteroidota bacterium]
MIERCIKIKCEIVKADSHENGLRKLLNFGHTIGHAIESLSMLSPTPLLHGEAVMIGMLHESRLSHQYTGLPLNQLKEIENVLNWWVIGLYVVHLQTEKELLSKKFIKE